MDVPSPVDVMLLWYDTDGGARRRATRADRSCPSAPADTNWKLYQATRYPSRPVPCTPCPPSTSRPVGGQRQPRGCVTVVLRRRGGGVPPRQRQACLCRGPQPVPGDGQPDEAHRSPPTRRPPPSGLHHRSQRHTRVTRSVRRRHDQLLLHGLPRRPGGGRCGAIAPARCGCTCSPTPLCSRQNDPRYTGINNDPRLPAVHDARLGCSTSRRCPPT